MSWAGRKTYLALAPSDRVASGRCRPEGRVRCTVESQVPSAVMTAVYPFRPSAQEGTVSQTSRVRKNRVSPQRAEGTAERPAASQHTLRHQFRRASLRRRRNYQNISEYYNIIII